MEILRFEEMCLVVNDILIQKSGLFFRIHEKKNKFRYSFHRTEEKNSTYKTLSSCIHTKFNGFNVAAPYLQKERKRDLYPIDIVYKPVKHAEEIIKCYFVTDIRFAYYGKVPNYLNKQITNRPYECYYCQKFFEKKNIFDRHVKFCSGKPGVVYNFEIQNIVTFEDNIKYQGDLPFALYADFETTAPTSDYLCPENDIMFSVSYSIVIAWHPKLNLPRQFVVRGFNHSLKELTDVTYLTSEQLSLRKQTTTEQFRDAAIAVSERKNRNAINILFNIESKFIYDILVKWFKYKIKSCHLEIPQIKRLQFERLNPLTEETKYVICHFPMRNQIKGLEFENNEQSYLDFLIKKEHTFIRNIFDEKELKNCKNISTLKNYHKAMTLYCNIIKNAEQEIKCVSCYDQIYDDRLKDFLMENAPAYEYDIPGLINDIKEIKVSNAKSKIPKFTTQMYYYFYDMLTDFPPCKFENLKTITTKNFFINFYRALNAKVHIHHSHVTSEIFGYSHDFCSWKVRENKLEIPLIGHNFLGFDIFYMVKGFRSSVWGTKNLNMGGTNLTNVNYATIGAQVKIIDTLKYYQTSLSALTSTANEKEKENISKNVLKFLDEHQYFNQIWHSVEKFDQEKILNIIESGKGIMPYEKITNIESLQLIPQNGFFDHTEFYSSLKQSNVTKEEYENCKFLYQKLKMRNLGDLNDLYNMQDVILLCKLTENRFQIMHEKFGFNPRKINSASTLSGCVQRDLSKVLIALPTCYEHAEIFEKSLIGGFTCVNTRIGFDSEILLPSFSKQEYAKMNIDGSFRPYKNQNYKLGYKLKMSWDKFYKDYRIISKIIKFDENNQYGYAMTKPMPVGSIKEKEANWLEFNLLLEKVDLDDEIGHLFLVDIELDQNKATPKQMLYNEIFPPVVEKKKILEANERSIFQLY